MQDNVQQLLLKLSALEMDIELFSKTKDRDNKDKCAELVERRISSILQEVLYICKNSESLSTTDNNTGKKIDGETYIYAFLTAVFFNFFAKLAVKGFIDEDTSDILLKKIKIGSSTTPATEKIIEDFIFTFFSKK